MKLLLIGAGTWGKNYITTIQQNWPHIQLDIATRQDWRHKVDQKPDGVMICTDPKAQVEIAKYVLEQHIPVMLEKPVALSLQELEHLLPLQHNAPILVNYIHLFANHFIELKKQCDKIKSIVSCGMGRGLVRSFSPLFDYGSHDIAMILYLLQQYPSQINCTDATMREFKDIFTIRLEFGKVKTQSIVSNTKDKMRRMTVNCYNGDHLIYDDLSQNRLVFNDLKYDIKYIPPLTNAIQCFIDLIGGKQDERAGLDLSIKVVRILEECYKQISK